MAAGTNDDQAQVRQLMKEGTRFYRLCIQTDAYCARTDGALNTPEVRDAVRDAADVALALVNVLARESRHGESLAAVARNAAESCASVLRPHEHDDEQVRVIFSVCRRFAHTCRVFLGEIDELEDAAHDETVKQTFPASDAPPPPTEL